VTGSRHHVFASVLAAARAGADWAWARLYDDLAGPLRGYLAASGAAEPDDLVGEVFLQVVRDLHRFAGDERAFRAWAFTIARHRLLDDARARRRRPVEPAPPETLDRITAPDSAEETLDRISDRRLRDLVQGLVPDQRDVLLLRIFAGLTVPEIAAALGKRPGAVKALQRRGLAALRRELDRQGVPLMGVPTLGEAG
jgi:RNA polymerase sigma factor (sigma-70 family)